MCMMLSICHQGTCTFAYWGKNWIKLWVILFEGMWESQGYLQMYSKSSKSINPSISKCFLMPRRPVPSTKIKAIREQWGMERRVPTSPSNLGKLQFWIRQSLRFTVVSNQYLQKTHSLGSLQRASVGKERSKKSCWSSSYLHPRDHSLEGYLRKRVKTLYMMKYRTLPALRASP